jgi:hypothetical protein
MLNEPSISMAWLQNILAFRTHEQILLEVTNLSWPGCLPSIAISQCSQVRVRKDAGLESRRFSSTHFLMLR